MSGDWGWLLASECTDEQKQTALEVGLSGRIFRISRAAMTQEQKTILDEWPASWVATPQRWLP